MKTYTLVLSLALTLPLASMKSQSPSGSHAPSEHGIGQPSDKEIVINFDSIEATHAPLVANDYLANYGITITNMTAGTTVVIDNVVDEYGGRSLKPSSSPNVLTQKGSNDPVSFTLSFETTYQSVRFTRVALIAGETGVTFPEWRAEALDSSGKILDKVGEPLGYGEKYYSDVPAQTFTLKGPGIKAVRFNSDNHHFAGFSALVFDDLILVPKKNKQ
jgi:hypothetical protein